MFSWPTLPPPGDLSTASCFIQSQGSKPTMGLWSPLALFKSGWRWLNLQIFRKFQPFSLHTHQERKCRMDYYFLVVLRKGLKKPKLALNSLYSWGCPKHLICCIHFSTTSIVGVYYHARIVSFWGSNRMYTRQVLYQPGLVSSLYFETRK